MTGFDALGAPEGNPASDLLLRDALEGHIPTGTRRRLWRDSAMPETGMLGSAMTLGGVAPAMGKGVVDAGLGLLRGVTWLGTAGQFDTSQMPQTIYDLLPEESANHLASRIARANIAGETDILGADVGSAAEITGGIASLVGGGAVGAIGKGAGKSADAVSKAAGAFTLPGKAVKALGFPGQKVGAKLAQIPQVAQWTRTAKVLPEVLGGATGFGLYNFVTQDGELGDRAGAMLHGAVAGGALAVLGRIAGTVEAKMLDKALGPDRLKAFGKIMEEARAGSMKGGWRAVGDAAEKLNARMASTLIEGTGFAMLDREFWDAALSGDIETAVSKYVETLPAALLARTGRMDAWKEFRRIDPEMNDLNLRREIIQTRRGASEQGPQDPPSGDPSYQGPGVPKPKGMDRQMQLAENAGYSNNLGPVDAYADPLLKSGWDIPTGVPKEGEIKLVFPGKGEVTLDEVSGQISVPRDIFKIVRGSDEIARAKELDTAYQWAKHLIAKSYPKEYGDSMEMMGKQQIEIDIDVDQARALLSHVPKGSVLHESIKSIVEADAPYGPVTASGIELARTVASWREKAGTHKNSERINSWLNKAAEEVHRWALVEKHGEGSLAGEVARKAPRVALPKMVDEMSGGIIMEGAIAEEFTRDLAAITMMRRMSGELRFGEEAWAGGPWKSEDGRLMIVGVDGQTYSKGYPAKAGEEWVKTEADAPDVTTEPQTPGQQQWLGLAQALRQTATPNPGLDLIETSVITAINGNPESPSVAELNMFLEQVNAEKLAEALTPANMEPLGMIMGQIGSGHMTAQEALVRLQEAMSAPPPAETAVEPEAAAEEPTEPQEAATGEEGFVDVGAIATGTESAVKHGVRKASQVRDYLYETRAEEIRRVIPDDTFSSEARTQMSNKRVIRAEAHTLLEPARKAASKMPREVMRATEPLLGGRAGIARWELLGDKRRKPRNELEEQFQKAWQEGNLFLWNKAREAGMVRDQEIEGGVAARPLPKRMSSVTQRITGPDAPEVYRDHELRRQWFEALEELNPGTTADYLESQFDKPAGVDIKDTDVQSALEHTRNLKTVPHTITIGEKTYEMREMDPRTVLSKIAEQQSAHIATAKQWGQDLTDVQRQQVREHVASLKKPSAEDHAAVHAMDRMGVRERKERVLEAAKKGDYSVMDPKAFKKSVDDWFTIMQGGASGEIHPLFAGVRAIDAVPRSLMVMKAAIYDIPELVSQPALYAGMRRTLKALHKIFGEMTPMEAIHHYERIGAISSKMTSLMYEETKGAVGAIVEWLGAPGVFSERFKGAMIAATADVMLESWDEWGSGKAMTRWAPKDAGLLAEMRFTPQEQTDLLTGKASEELRNKFRNEFVQRATGRAEAGEGPRSADNPNMTATFRFMRLMSMMTGGVIRRMKIMSEARKKHGAYSKQYAKETGRWASMVSMRTLSGSAALAIGIALQQVLRGEPEETLERLEREMWRVPGAALLEAFMKQNVGGQAGLVVESADASTSERALRGASAITDVSMALWHLVKAANSGAASATDFSIEAAKQLHYIPLQSDMSRLVPRLEEWAVAALAGEETSLRSQAISDRDRALEFLRGPGKDVGLLGLQEARSQFHPSKTSAFYDAMDKGMKEFWRGSANGGAEEGVKRAYATFESAIKDLGEKPTSVAAWIRSQKVTSIIGNDKISDFWDFIGEEAMDGIDAREKLLDHLAGVVGKIESAPLPDWAERVEDLRKMASVGTGDWTTVVNEAVKNASDQMKVSKSMRGIDLGYIREIAPIIASNKSIIGDVFRGGDGEYLQGLAGKPAEFSRLTRYIEQLLTDRAAKRTTKSFKDATK